MVTDFDLYDLLLKGDKSKDVLLLPEDVIYISPVGPQVAMGGQVNVPAIYELKNEATLGDVLQLAGGLVDHGLRRQSLRRADQEPGGRAALRK